LNYYFSIILQDNLGMSELMARVLTGANATSYCVSTAMAFWIIDRRGRRFLMLTGLSLQCAAYIMVAIAVAMLATAPQQVSCRDNTYAYILIYADTSKWGAVAITFLFAYYAAFGYVS
jgi:MFS family permease